MIYNNPAPVPKAPVPKVPAYPQSFSKYAKQTLVGIDRQLEDLKEVSANIDLNLNNDLDAIKDKIKILSERFPVKEKIDYLDQLEAIKNKFDGYQEKINGISRLYLSEKIEKFIELSESDFSDEVKESTEELFAKIADQLSYPKRKLVQWGRVSQAEENTLKNSLNYFILKIKKIINDFSIIKELKNSLIGQEHMLKDLKDPQALKESWLKTLLTFRKWEFKLKWEISKNKYQQFLNIAMPSMSIESAFEKFLPHFKSICITKLKDLSKEEKITCFTEYNEEIKTLNEKFSKFNEIKQFAIENYDKIKKEIETISERLKTNEMRSEDQLPFLDKTMREKIKNHKEDEKIQLHTQEDFIRTWNRLCRGLNHLIHQINLLGQFKRMNEKITACYLLAEDILQESETKTFESKMSKFSQLCKIAEKNNTDIKQSQIKILEVRKNEIPLSSEAKSNALQESLEPTDLFDPYICEDMNLLQEYTAAMSLQPTYLYENFIHPGHDEMDSLFKYGFEKNDAEFQFAFKSDKVELCKELKEYQENTKQAFQMLKDITAKAVKRINDDIKARSQLEDEQKTDASFLSGLSSTLRLSSQSEELTGTVRSPF
jgi:hypothetical protein